MVIYYFHRMKKWMPWLLLLLCYTAQSQVITETIRGTITDKDSKVPLPGATVVVLNSNPLLGSSTDIDGKFNIAKVPVGFQNIKVTLLGYENIVIPNVLVNAGKEVVLNIEMTEEVKHIDEVVVVAKNGKNEPMNELAVVSTQAFSVEDTKRYAGGFNDPSRMAQSFAGVGGGDDDVQNAIVIRGNSSRGLMWQVEGVEVPTPNHFADNGSSSGGVSMLSTQMLATSDFSTGAFPADYGNATAGVFDINLRNGNNEKHEFTVQASLIGLDASAEGPFRKGKNASFLFNYRYSTLALLDKMGLKVFKTGLPVFQDLSFKIHLPTKKAGVFNIFGIGGISSVLESEDGYINDSTQGRLWNMDSGASMGVVGISNNYIVNPKFYIKSTAAFATQYIYNFRDELDEHNVMSPFHREKLYNHYGKAQMVFNNKFNARHSLKSGIIYTLEPYNLSGQYYDTLSNKLEPLLDAKGITHVLQVYSTWRYRITEHLKLIAGVHGMYFFLNNRYSIEPRTSVQYSLPRKQTLSFAFGMHSRRESIAQYLAKERLADGTLIENNRNLDFTRALHYVLSYQVLLKPFLNLKVELYYQQQYNVPITGTDTSTYSLLNLTNSFAADPLVNKGKGRNYGVEVTLEKYFQQNYFILITGSLFNATYTPADGKERNTVFNNNYITNVSAGKEFLIGKHKNNSIGASTHLIVAGGKRYTPINVAASNAAGFIVYNPSDINAKSTPIYYRIDLSLYFRRNRKRANMEFRVDVQNITNRVNVVNYEYSERQQRLLTQVTGQLVPVLGFKVEF